MKLQINYKCTISLIILMFVATTLATWQSRANEPLPIIDPCVTDYIKNQPLKCEIPWNGPSYDTVCMNQLPPYESECGPPYNCCFIIQYYDRIIQCPNDDDAQYYDIQVTQLSYLEQCSDCYQIVKDRIEMYIINKKNQDNAFYFQYKWNEGGGCIEQHHYTSKGNCYNGQDTIDECTNERCCVKRIRICYDTDGYVIPELTLVKEEYLFADKELDSLDNQPLEGVVIPCAQLGCNDGTPKCGKHSHHVIDDPCDSLILCNNAPWVRDSITNYSMVLFGCPICSIKVYYQKKDFDCGNKNYHDIRLTKIEKMWNDNYCDSCLQVNLGDTTIPYAAIYWHIVKKVVDTVASSYLEPEECDTNFRIFNYSCWNENTFTGDYEPCVANGCCVGRYSVCKLNNIIYTQKLESVTTGSVACTLAAAPCEYICDDESLPKITIANEYEIKNSSCIFNSKIVPNPNEGTFEFHVASSEVGKLDIVIYDLLGRVVYRIKNQAINSFIKIPVSIDVQNNSILYYSITLNNRYTDYQIINIQR